MPSGRGQWLAAEAIYSRFGEVQVTGLWFAISLLFTAYVSHFGSYDKTYGTLGALISLLIWLWLGNLAFLLGALFNAETHRIGGEGS
jgi:membrane protein